MISKFMELMLIILDDVEPQTSMSAQCGHMTPQLGGRAFSSFADQDRGNKSVTHSMPNERVLPLALNFILSVKSCKLDSVHICQRF